jgi:ubiquitin carboxyl-terminal hydrolase 16/45
MQCFFANISSGSRGTASPKQLFVEVCKKATRFRGFQQQDSQELLRYLLDAMKTEEIKRIKRGILEIFGCNGKRTVEEMDDETKHQIRIYGRCATRTFVDSVFCGELASIVICQQCNDMSVIYEPFLDLSLPLRTESRNDPGRSQYKKSSKGRGQTHGRSNSHSQGQAATDGLCQEANKQNNTLSKHKQKQQAKMKRKDAKKKQGHKSNTNVQVRAEMEGKDTAETEEETVGASPSNKSGDGDGDGDCTKTLSQTEDSGVEQTCSTKVETETKEFDESNNSREVLDEDADVLELCSMFENCRIQDEVGEQLESKDQDKQDIVVEEARSTTNTNNTNNDNNVLSGCTTVSTILSDLNTECTDSGITVQLESSKETRGCDVICSDQEVAVDQSRPEPVEVSSGDMVGIGTDSLVNSSTVKNDSLVTSSNVGEQESELLEQGVGLDTQPKSNVDTSIDAIATECTEANDCQVLETQAKGVLVTQQKQLIGTLAPCYVPRAGEVSLQACLAQFCSVEMLDGTNRFRCDHCTQLAHEREQNANSTVSAMSDEAFPVQDQTEVAQVERSELDEQIAINSPSRAKTDLVGQDSDKDSDADKSDALGTTLLKKSASPAVYSVATKQLLLHSLPPVLTLHLKRFEQVGYGLRKISECVPFPFVLDVTPFCTEKCKTPVDRQGQILYSLYGVVEHGGSLRSGHYTAYVKVRSSACQLQHRQDIPELLKTLPEDVNAVEAEGGSWYHVSDSSVSLASEDQVQSCQAYILFYERK